MRGRDTLDCVSLKRRAQAAIYEETKDLTPEEQIAYFREAARTGRLGQWWQRVGARESRKPASGRAA